MIKVYLLVCCLQLKLTFAFDTPGGAEGAIQQYLELPPGHVVQVVFTLRTAAIRANLLPIYAA